MGNKIIYFISTNEHKIKEAQSILAQNKSNVEIKSFSSADIKEIQSKDMEEIVLDKAMKAYKLLRRPLIVEHTGLLIDDFGGLPGGLTQIFWSSFSPPATSNKEADNMATCKKFCEHFGGKKVKAVSWVAFCDGKQIKTYKGETSGTIPTEPLGKSPFQWDPVFVPDGCSQSFAQLAEEEKKEEKKDNKEEEKVEKVGTAEKNKKNQISMRRKALDLFAKDLQQMCGESLNELSETGDQHIQDIRKKLSEDKLVLFIGSGVSKPLNLPDWNELIGQLAKDVDFSDPKVFALYGDNLTLAEYYKIVMDKSDKSTPLTNWMQKNLSLSADKVKESRIHQELAKLDCSTIYTTNYDRALENTFPVRKRVLHTNTASEQPTATSYEEVPPHTVANIAQLASAPADAIQIIKFHGDMNDENSIVLAERDYFKRLNFDTPLDIKLRADMLSKSFLFLGYSMSDINIRLLSYKLDQLWKESGNDTDRPKSYIFMGQPNPIQEEIFRNRGIIPIVGEDTDLTESLLKFLQKLHD